MKKILLLSLALSLGLMNAQTTIFEDSFDTYTDFAISGVGSWTLTDVDLKTTYGFSGISFTNEGAAKSFQVFNSTTTNPAMTNSTSSNWSARTGSKAMVAFASDASPWNNDWMISPKILLGSTGNVVSFWAKSCDTTFGNEKFKVLVSTTNTNASSFTLVSANPVSSPADATWHQYTYNLDAYAGQNIHIAIQCVSQDQFGLAVDDFKVTTTGTVLATNENVKSSKSNIEIYPNPTSDFVNIKSEQKIESISITDITGKKANVRLEGDKVNVRNLTSGNYLITVETKDGITTEKFIKK